MPPVEIHLTAPQRRALRRLLRNPPNVHTYQRAVAVLAVDEGEPVAAIAARLGVSRQAVYHWVAAYAQTPTTDSLRDHYGGGRPSLWTAALRSLLAQALSATPEEAGLAGPHWTVPLLRDYLDRQGGPPPSDDTIRRELQRLGYVWKRFRYVLPPDPELEKKTAHPPAAAAVATPERQAV
jgi:transposase